MLLGHLPQITMWSVVIALSCAMVGDTRADVMAEATRALPTWLASVTPDRLQEFGFASASDTARARALMAIPLRTPARTLSRQELEATLHQPSPLWIVPIAVGSRIACLMILDTNSGRPQVAEFGKTFAAQRLDAAIRLLAPARVDLSRAVMLSYVSPVTDLLLVDTGAGRWRWFNLTGTTDAKASEMTPDDVTQQLERLRAPIREPGM
jgi:hypothetical protein